MPAHQELRPAFLAAQGLPVDTAWCPSGTVTDVNTEEWASIPSEQYAEAMVELVLGGRPIRTGARVSPGAIHVLEAWARGD